MMVIDCSPPGKKNRLLEERRMFRHPLTSATAEPQVSISFESLSTTTKKTLIVTSFHPFVTVSTV
jgi:hypothetical protein